MGVNGRIARLERAAGGGRCPTCKGLGRPRVIVVTEPGQSPALLRDQVRCPECGAIPRAVKAIRLGGPSGESDSDA